MSISYFNNEHYADPTAYHAMRELEKERIIEQVRKSNNGKTVFISVPVRGSYSQEVDNAVHDLMLYAKYCGLKIITTYGDEKFGVRKDSAAATKYRDVKKAAIKECDAVWTVRSFLADSGVRFDTDVAFRTRKHVRCFPDCFMNLPSIIKGEVV